MFFDKIERLTKDFRKNSPQAVSTLFDESVLQVDLEGVADSSALLKVVANCKLARED
jgi:hypothetical protein